MKEWIDLIYCCRPWRSERWKVVSACLNTMFWVNTTNAIVSIRAMKDRKSFWLVAQFIKIKSPLIVLALVKDDNTGVLAHRVPLYVTFTCGCVSLNDIEMIMQMKGFGRDYMADCVNDSLKKNHFLLWSAAHFTPASPCLCFTLTLPHCFIDEDCEHVWKNRQDFFFLKLNSDVTFCGAKIHKAFKSLKTAQSINQ